MTSLLEGAKRLVTRGSDIGARVGGLDAAVQAARGRLDDDVVDPAAAVVDRATQRLRLSARHTIVALAGATGSGKSSTFNALTGLDLSSVGVRRPTTSWTTACTWGNEPAPEILEWLGIPPRHQVLRDSMLDTTRTARDLDGLVLLDLPDHDSTEVAHHLEADRLVRLADLLVWVLDPQKYADALIHDKYLRPMAGNKDVMLVVVNHIDEVPPARRDGLLADVRRLLDADGLVGVPVLATSARTGEGIDELRRAIATRVTDKAAARQRIGVEIGEAAVKMGRVNGDARPPRLAERDTAELHDAVADAAGVPLVVDAVHRASSIRARQATGWPLTAWLGKLRPDPLKRLHLDLSRGDRDLVAAARSSIPQATQVQRARTESAVRGLSDHLSEGLTRPWASAFRRASTSRVTDLNDALDRAVGGTELGVSRTPVWCRLVRALQWLLLLAAVGGGVWLGALAVMGYLRLPEPGTPEVSSVPVPTLLLVGGVVVGLLLALVSRGLIAIGSRSRARRADQRLRDAVAGVCDELVLEPLQQEVAAYRAATEGLRAARG
ncbi:MAG TPA: GTPase [Marmoricola sp.]|jgi:GTP-binding protein EngB required for normal cell division|nr:GTPase [Marmoricola sp.]